MQLFGLNVASSSQNRNGRGWVEPETGHFVYMPIEEAALPAMRLPTYEDLGFADVRYPHLPVHLDPEFTTHTYGHVRRFGDQALFKMKGGDILFFYATLDLLPKRKAWGVYIIGFFDIDYVVDARSMTDDAIKNLSDFHGNAHLKRRTPQVELLVKGRLSSRLFSQAIRLSDSLDAHLLDTQFGKVLSTVTGKPLQGPGWHRWLMYSRSRTFAALLHSNP